MQTALFDLFFPFVTEQQRLHRESEATNKFPLTFLIYQFNISPPATRTLWCQIADPFPMIEHICTADWQCHSYPLILFFSFQIICRWKKKRAADKSKDLQVQLHRNTGPQCVAMRTQTHTQQLLTLIWATVNSLFKQFKPLFIKQWHVVRDKPADVYHIILSWKKSERFI